MNLTPRRLPTLVNSALVVALTTVIVKGVGAGKELVVAYRLGTMPELGAFLFAYTFPMLFVTVTAATLQVVLVPKYLELQSRQGPDAAARFASTVLGRSALWLGGLCLVLAPLCNLVIPSLARGFMPATLAICRMFVLLLMPTLWLNGLAQLCMGLLNANGRYRFAGLVPLITPLCVVLALATLWSVAGTYALIVGTLGGATLELLLILWRIRHEGIRLAPTLGPLGDDERAILVGYAPLALASVIMASSSLIEQTFAARLSAIDVAKYAYGTRLTTIGSAILVTTLSTVLLPYFAKARAAGGTRSLMRVSRPAAIAVALVSIPVALVVSVFSAEITALVYQRGKFSAADAGIVAKVQAIHAWSIPAYALSVVALRALNAATRSNAVLIGGILNALVCLVVNVTLVPTLGVTGIAWANVGMYVASCAWLWYAADRLSRGN